MQALPLSLMLVTSGRQPLIQHSLVSLLSQVSENDEVTVSINSSDQNHIAKTRAIIESVDPNQKIRIILTCGDLSVYEHYKFGILNAMNSHMVIVHDDDIYHSQMIDEIRKGFSDPTVTTVVGGLIKINLTKTGFRSAIETSFESSSFVDGKDWLQRNSGLYPPFCFSAVAINRSAIDLSIFTPDSTAADCLAITQLALSGTVYQSDLMFATWMQLPSSTSKWALIKPGSISPWKEYLTYFQKNKDIIMTSRALAYKQRSLRVFIKMLFFVGIANRNPTQIKTSLLKIGEINKSTELFFSWTTLPFIFSSLSGPCKIAVKWRKNFIIKYTRSNKKQPDPRKSLNISNDLWDSYISSASALI